MDMRSRTLRKLVIAGLESGGKGHVGSSMSLIEILRALYDDFLTYDPQNPSWPERDRLILSKGHGCLALFALLVDKGFINRSALDTVCQKEAMLGGHPEKFKIPGIEASTGALGHGLSIGVGMAQAAKIKEKNYRVVVITGDGELNEGSIWEAAMHAAKHRLSNLSVFVDYNKIQCFGPTYEVLDLEPLADKWKSFGFEVIEVDGHDVEALRDVMGNIPVNINKPTVVICHTVKGKGISFAENTAEWHHRHHFEKEDIARMYASLDE